MTMCSQSSDFIKSSTKTILKIGEQSPETIPALKSQGRDISEILAKSKQLHIAELHPVFSHMNILLIETLSETQHGQFSISSKKGKYQTIVELSGHISHRYHLTPHELQIIKQVNNQIIETRIAYYKHFHC